jgi:hypothetical protein
MPHRRSRVAPTNASDAKTAEPYREPLWTQKQAAAFLRVSVRYLRSTGCPRVALPGNGLRGRRVVRYDPGAVKNWAQSNGSV